MSGLKCVMLRNLSDEDKEAVQLAIRETGFKQANRAIMTTLKSFTRLVRIVKNLEEENNRLRTENRKMKKCLSTFTEAVRNIDTILEERELENPPATD